MRQLAPALAGRAVALAVAAASATLLAPSATSAAVNRDRARATAAEAPYLPVVFVDYPTVVRVRSREATWGITINTHPYQWDTRGGAQALTVQLAYGPIAPLNTQAYPTVASYANGIAAFAPAIRWRSRLRPSWVRIGSRVGQWTDWQPIQPI